MRFPRLSMYVIAAALLGLIAVLATLQYRWLAQISESEREQMRGTLSVRAKGFAEDFDRELNRAYLLFQLATPQPDENAASQLAVRYDRWQTLARYPRIVKDVYLASSGGGLQRYDAATRFVEPAQWPDALKGIRDQLARNEDAPPVVGTGLFVRPVLNVVWPDTPALVVRTPLLVVSRTPGGARDFHMPPRLSYTILHLDGDYIRNELLPALAQQHFQRAGEGVAYQLAVVPTTGAGAVYHSTPGFVPAAGAKVDVSADLFQIRPQDFAPLSAELSRFAVYASLKSNGARGAHTQTIVRQTISPPLGMTIHDNGPMSIVLSSGRSDSQPISEKLVAGAAAATALGSAARAATAASLPHWRLVVQHPSGSLEHAVDTQRRRNLLISSTILGILGLSLGFLVVSTRRAHDLARQQLEFVATVSHELRTPLAVIRSAGDNLADGVVGDEPRVRQYGQLVRREGLRLTDLVEQILEFAGLQSGQRAIVRRPVTIDTLLRECAAAIQADADAASVTIDLDIADRLPPVAGDEAALRRVFLNLLGNAIKYGASAGWVGVRASGAGTTVDVAVSDRGIGIAPVDQQKIFDPFYRTPTVVAAQIQGAGLGLSLVKRIVEAHGGRIAIASTPGQGSTFTVSLPVASADLTPAPRGVGETAPQAP